MPEQTLRARFERDHSGRTTMLDRARKAASLTDPSILPPDGHTKDLKLPESFQSVGPRGLINMSGLMLTSLFPLTQPWFRIRLPAKVRYDSRIPPEQINQAEAILFATELIVTGTLESSGAGDERGRRRTSFRAKKRAAIDQVLVTGDVLEYLTPDYRLKVFRRDQYVTRRDTAGDVLYHVIAEKIDPLSLTDEQFAATKFDLKDYEDRDPAERLTDLHTLVEWQPRTKRWMIRQEVDGKRIPFENGKAVMEETVSPYFATAFKLTPGEDYGRGFFEMNLGELSSLNELEMRRLDILALAAKQLIAIDHSSPTRETDLEKESGGIIRARVVGGEVDDVGTVGFGNVQEFQMLTVGIQDKTKNLSAAMLIESGIAPNKDRVTATQIDRIARELDGALGGLYANIADDQQIPLLRRMLVQLRAGNSIPVFPEKLTDFETTTGLAALQREGEGNKMLEFAQVMQQLGPEAISRIDVGVFVDAYMRARSLMVPGLRKSEAKVQEERAEALKMVAAQQAIASGGKIMENQAAQAA